MKIGSIDRKEEEEREREREGGRDTHNSWLLWSHKILRLFVFPFDRAARCVCLCHGPMFSISFALCENHVTPTPLTQGLGGGGGGATAGKNKYKHYKVITQAVSVTSKKLPNVYKRCPKMISLEKGKILTPFHKLPKNVWDLGKIIVAKGFEKLPKVQ